MLSFHSYLDCVKEERCPNFWAPNCLTEFNFAGASAELQQHFNVVQKCIFFPSGKYLTSGLELRQLANIVFSNQGF